MIDAALEAEIVAIAVAHAAAAKARAALRVIEAELGGRSFSVSHQGVDRDALESAARSRGYDVTYHETPEPHYRLQRKSGP
ncbi:MAG TPA: hypothetical protein VFB35_02585 [Gaiellaceae bacterium]|nr:hypothetical protein [Gaiellaceae bacterium]